MECIFCKIAQGAIPVKKAFENERILAFQDINPQAPVHILVISKEHIPSFADVKDEQLQLLAELQGVIRDLAGEAGLEKGYRVVVNCGEDGGQEVQHLHYHLLGGRKMLWPPG